MFGNQKLLAPLVVVLPCSDLRCLAPTRELATQIDTECKRFAPAGQGVMGMGLGQNISKNIPEIRPALGGC